MLFFLANQVEVVVVDTPGRPKYGVEWEPCGVLLMTDCIQKGVEVGLAEFSCECRIERIFRKRRPVRRLGWTRIAVVEPPKASRPVVHNSLSFSNGTLHSESTGVACTFFARESLRRFVVVLAMLRRTKHPRTLLLFTTTATIKASSSTEFGTQDDEGMKRSSGLEGIPCKVRPKV
jgi:hypothetical protein